MFVVMYGGIGDGMNVVGPFKDVADAVEYAEWHFRGEILWEVIELRALELKKDLNPLTREEFLENMGMVCPYCHQESTLEFVDMNYPKSGRVAETLRCDKCKRKHIQHYTLTDWEETAS